MRSLLTRLVDFPHELVHRIRCALSPAYAKEAALAWDLDRLEFLTECALREERDALARALMQLTYANAYRDFR